MSTHCIAFLVVYSVFFTYFFFPLFFFFFFNDTATTEIYTLSLHDALPISGMLDGIQYIASGFTGFGLGWLLKTYGWGIDRKSTRLNSSHSQISYAVFCLKKKKQPHPPVRTRQYRTQPAAGVRRDGPRHAAV